MIKRLFIRFICCFTFLAFVTGFRISDEGQTYQSADAQAPAYMSHGLKKYETETGKFPYWMAYIFCGMPSMESLLYTPRMYTPSFTADVLLKTVPGWILLALWVAYQFEFNSKLKKRVPEIKNYVLCFYYWAFFSILGVVLVAIDAVFYPIAVQTMLLLFLAAWLANIISFVHQKSFKFAGLILVSIHAFIWIFRLQLL